MVQVIKRDGTREDFNPSKINAAVAKAAIAVGLEDEATTIGDYVSAKVCQSVIGKKEISIYDVEKFAEVGLMTVSPEAARQYIEYRQTRKVCRDSMNEFIDAAIKLTNVENENANMPEQVFTAKITRISNEALKKYASDVLVSAEHKRLHDEGIIYIHDFNSYATGMQNCMFLDMADLLSKPIHTTNGTMRSPKSIGAALSITAVVIQCQSNAQFGGVSVQSIDFAMEKYIEMSFYKNLKKVCQILEVDYDYYAESYRKSKKALYNGAFIDLMFSDTDELTGTHVKPIDNAFRLTVEETKQACEAFLHNLNHLESRAGNQLPFSSINYGCCESWMGKLFIKSMLECTIDGIGEKKTTPIFPQQIWQYHVKEDGTINNEDLFELANACSIKRYYPNYVNVNKEVYDVYDEKGELIPDLISGTMGCTDPKSVITVKIDGVRHVNSFENIWDMLSKFSEIKTLGFSEYIEHDDFQILDQEGFVDVHRIIKNPDRNNWIRLKMNGHTLLLTEDHPLPILGRGRIRAKDVTVGDKIDTIFTSPTPVPENNISLNMDAWLLGLTITDGCYDSHYTISLGNDETSIVDHMLTLYPFEVIRRNRKAKGDYLDVKLKNSKKYQDYLYCLFGGYKKLDRSIPQEIFNGTRINKLKFVAGMLDGDGYVRKHRGRVVCALGSTNHTLALQQQALLKELGIHATVYLNKHNRIATNGLYNRLVVTFNMTEELVQYVKCDKKRNVRGKYGNTRTFSDRVATISDVIFLGELEEPTFSYDVETASDMFILSGVHSHNCRTRLGANKHGSNGKSGRGNLSPATINLPKLALMSSTPSEFRQMFLEHIDKAVDIMMTRFVWQSSQKMGSAPFMYKNGTWKHNEKYDETKTIGDILRTGTLAVGFIGVAEASTVLFGDNHYNLPYADEFFFDLLTEGKKKVDELSDKLSMNISLYATPAESLCHTFAKKLRDQYGEIPNVSDKDFITNSYHVPVWQSIPFSEKIKLEAKYHDLCVGGCITYVEMRNDITPQQYGMIVKGAMAEGLYYFCINIAMDRCLNCDLEDVIVNEENKHNPICPKCGSDDVVTLRRVTGYITSSYHKRFNDGKKQEVDLRVKHS